MIELSLVGFAGAFAGTIVAAFAYPPLVMAIQHGLRLRTPEEAALLRRAVLAFDILVFAGVGYWLGTLIAG
ncbi:MAG TPA: hypothetical protein VN689_00805 [Burkholderiales bacterium]|jgi:hypothetical protein|nr:hypothetical protein [Burkholderiales bacterium]